MPRSGQAAVGYLVAGEVAFVTLNRPEVCNAVDARIREELPEAVARAGRDPAVRVVVLRGAGPRAFCAGADLGEPAPARSLVDARAAKQLPRLTDSIMASAKPTLAAVHGYCIGLGLEIGLACDVRIATGDAVFALPEVGLGMPGGAQRLARALGIGHALRIALTGSRIQATDALAMGLVSAVVSREQLAAATSEWAARLAAGSPHAIAYAREAIRRGSELPLEEGLRLEGRLSAMLRASDGWRARSREPWVGSD